MHHHTRSSCMLRAVFGIFLFLVDPVIDHQRIETSVEKQGEGLEALNAARSDRLKVLLVATALRTRMHQSLKVTLRVCRK